MYCVKTENDVNEVEDVPVHDPVQVVAKREVVKGAEKVVVF